MSNGRVRFAGRYITLPDMGVGACGRNTVTQPFSNGSSKYPICQPSSMLMSAGPWLVNYFFGTARCDPQQIARSCAANDLENGQRLLEKRATCLTLAIAGHVDGPCPLLALSGHGDRIGECLL